MKIQDQVCTLEQAKKLKELGVLQDAYLCWYTIMISDSVVIPKEDVIDDYHAEVFAAFSVAEFGVMLPSEEYTVYFGRKPTNNWDWNNDMNRECSGPYETEAFARAERLIYLFEKGEVTVAEVNERLSL